MSAIRILFTEAKHLPLEIIIFIINMSKTNRPDGKRHLVWKWFLGIFAFIFLVAVAAAIYINNKWRPLLTETIQNTVIQTSDSLYRVKFSNIKINLLTGSAYLDSVVIYPDTLI